MARRNRDLADAAFDLLRHDRRWDVPVWDLAIRLLARGSYRGEPAPMPLAAVLASDARFLDAGLDMWTMAEAVTPELEADIQRRKQFGGELRSYGEQRFPHRAAKERTLADVVAAVAGRSFESKGELDRFLQDLLATGGPPYARPRTPLEEAQDLVYAAWDASSQAERIRLARQALRCAPDCANAYVLLAEEAARTLVEAAGLYGQGVAAGERALGPALFEREASHFWGILETRPYMRARLGLAMTLWELGQRRDLPGRQPERPVPLQ